MEHLALILFGLSGVRFVMAVSKGFIRNPNFAYRRKEVLPNEVQETDHNVTTRPGMRRVISSIPERGC